MSVLLEYLSDIGRLTCNLGMLITVLTNIILK